MEQLYYISVLLFTLYFIGCWISFGIKPTISHWFYNFPPEFKWITPAIYCNIAWPLAFVSDFDTFTSIALGFIALTGFLPYFRGNKDKLQDMLHVVFASGSALFIVFSALANEAWILWPLFLLVAIIGLIIMIWKPKNYGTWSELVGFGMGFGYIYLNFAQ